MNASIVRECGIHPEVVRSLSLYEKLLITGCKIAVAPKKKTYGPVKPDHFKRPFTPRIPVVPDAKPEFGE